MLRLADTSIRLYRKKNGKVSLVLRSYLMVTTNVSFRLGAYLKNLQCRVTLPSGENVEFNDIYYSDDCDYALETMVHDFRARAESNINIIEDGIGKLRLDYHISFTDHPYEEPSFLEIVVPLVAVRSKYKPAIR